MKKFVAFIRRNWCKVISAVCALVISLLSMWGGFAYADGPATWADLGEDAIAVRDAYFTYFTSTKSTFSDWFKQASDIPLSWAKSISDLGWCISPIDNIYYYLKDGTLSVRSTDAAGGGGGHLRSGSRGSGGYCRNCGKPAEDCTCTNFDGDAADFYPLLSGEDLKSAAADYNSRYMPLVVQDSYVWSYNSSTTTKQNPKKASDWINSFTFYPTVPVYSNTSTVWGGKGWGGSKEKGVYILPFWVDDDSSYGTCFNKYYIHLYAIAATSDTTAKLCMDLYNLSDNSLAKSYSVDWSSDYSYLGFTFYSAFTIFGYKSNADYYAHKSASQRLRSDANMTLNYYSSDYKAVYWNSMIVASTFCPDTDKSDDWGYYVQNSPFELFANQTSIDFNRIPNNFIITINGDTIYDYSITNPDTGDTTDIDDYIKHDYDIPDVEDPDNPDDNGGGGSISGNVTVGGKVDVSGKIEIDTKPIDININVNSGGSSGGYSGTGEAFDMSNYLDKLPEQSETMNDYLKSFFSFLPPELLALIIGGVAAAILCRVLGR